MKKMRKPAGCERYLLPAELAGFLGVTTRTLRRWCGDETFPPASTRTEQGYKLWSPEQAQAALAWRERRGA